MEKEKINSKELIHKIDMLQVWAAAHPCSYKIDLLKLRKKYILELEKEYIDECYLRHLRN